MMAWFEACVSLSGSAGPHTCSESDFTTVDSNLASWFNADKLDYTGWVWGFDENNSTRRTNLAYSCETIELDAEDYITNV